jgi:hypothetical protein
MDRHFQSGEPVPPERNDRWLSLLRSARWFREPPTHADTLRCGACRVDFAPGSEGAATFIEQRGAIIVRVCPGCEPMFADAASDQRQFT